MSGFDANFTECVNCGGARPEAALRAGDPFCSRGCAETAGGLGDVGERRRLGVPPGHDLYGPARMFADMLGVTREEFWRLRTNRLATGPGSLAHLVPLNRPGWFATTLVSWQAVEERYESLKDEWRERRIDWAKSTNQTSGSAP